MSGAVTEPVTNTREYGESIAHIANVLGDSKPIIQRYKGLGEMNWQELRESTMAEGSRRLIRITPDNIEWCEQVLDTCMNDKSIAARKEFITSDDIYDLV